MLAAQLYREINWKGWTNLETIHLLINHRNYMDKESPIKEFNEENIWTYNRTYGIMVRSILKHANLYLPLNDKFIHDNDH